uniref:Uncharacterized protein n=1 Tax=Sus scrofa TaxID=9823 RepID=A0A8D1B218_PIG
PPEWGLSCARGWRKTPDQGPRARGAAASPTTFATSLGATWWISWSPRSRFKGPLVKPGRAQRGQAPGPAGSRVLPTSPPSFPTTMIWATTCGQTSFKVRLKGKGGCYEHG